MGIPSGVFPNQAHHLKDLIDLFIDVGFVLDAVDDHALGDDLLNGHTGVQRSDGILEDHLDLGNQLRFLCHPQGVFIFLLQPGVLGLSLRRLQQGSILFLDFLHKLSRIFGIAVLVVVHGLFQLRLLGGDVFLQLLDLGCGVGRSFLPGPFDLAF